MMVKLEDNGLEKIKSLPPKERVERLRKLKKKHEEEMKKAERLMQNSIAEAEEEDEKKREESEREEAADSLGKIIVPEPVDLETSVEAEQIPQADEEEYMEYVSQLAQRPIYDLQQEARDIINEGNIGYEQIKGLSQIGDALYQKKKDIDEGAYSPSEKIMMEIDSTKRIIDDVMGKYKR